MNLGDEMTRTSNAMMNASEETLVKRMEKLAHAVTEFGAIEIAEKLGDLISAIRFQDKAIKSSAARTTVDAICVFLDDHIEKHVGMTRLFRKATDDFFSTLCNKAIGHTDHFVELDRLGKINLDALDRKLKELSSVAQVAQMLFASGFSLQNGRKLQQEKESAMALRKMIAESWPWAYTQNQHPVDKEMVSRSRKAFLNKECESIEQATERLSGVTPQNDTQG